MTRDALRLLIFDATQRARKPFGLGLSWQLGASGYRTLGRMHAVHGARSLASALRWLASYEPARPIAELQFWGHGKWGRVFIDGESLDRSALSPGHALHGQLQAFRERLAPEALIWFRTCETLGAQAGHDFAAALSDFTGASVAGHTYVIGFLQSGLHALAPGARPDWSPSEGLARGSAALPKAALASHPAAPNTITCLTSTLPSRLQAR